MAKRQCKSVTLEVKLDGICRMYTVERAIDVAGLLTLPPTMMCTTTYKSAFLGEEERKRGATNLDCFQKSFIFIYICLVIVCLFLFMGVLEYNCH